MTAHQTDRTRRLGALVLLALAYVALIPGLTMTVIDLSGALEKSEVAALGKQLIAESNSLSMFSGMANRFIDGLDADGQIEVYRQKRSILDTIRELAVRGHLLVAFLVGLFSVVVPVVKGGLTVYGNVGSWTPARQRAAELSGAVAKWSMADVFVIAMFVTFLAARATQNSGELVRFDADFGAGFYFFALYCVLSVAASSLMPARVPDAQPAPPAADA